MNSLVKDLLSIGDIEYLIINQEFQIIQTSSRISDFIEEKSEISIGADVRIFFPELVGTEDILEAIRQEEEEHFKITGVYRSKSSCSALYLDINIIKNIEAIESNDEIMIFIIDVTEQMVIEKTLVQTVNEANLLLRDLTASKQFIDTIVTSMPDALLVTTPLGKIKKTNPAAQFILGYTEAELNGEAVTNFIEGLEGIHGNKDIFCSPTPITKEIETRCRTKSGKIIPIAISCSTVQTGVEHFQGYVYILRDMTERKQAELAKQEFLATISHEVRTPITAINGMSSLLLNTELTSQQREFVDTIYSSGEALLRIINDFLDFSKIESGKLELEEQPFSIETCINEVIHILLPQAKQKGIELIFNYCQKTPALVLGDVTRLRQILINLVSNAIKFTHEGSVEICVINRSNDNHLNQIEFAIRDTGIGIHQANFDCLFKCFSQVNSSITRQYGGTGLGLAICKRLAELMGGKIWVESELGKGSTFYFTIAVTSFEMAADYQKSDLATTNYIDVQIATENPLRILLVEDNTINQKMISLILQQMGYQPDIVNNGLEALELLRHQIYDVVLMDVQMPQMDGLTATKAILENLPPHTHPQIIALTASAMWGERERCLAAGMDGYLTKPIRVHDLVQILKKCHPIELAQLPSPNPLDFAALQEILSMANFNSRMNSGEFLIEIINCYIEESDATLQNLQIAESQGNIKTLRRLAHTFSSTSATVGAINLASLCGELELMAATESLTAATESITKIQIEYEQVKTALQRECQKYNI